MDINEGSIDRLIRIAVGIVGLMLLPVTFWGFLGLIPLMTGLMGWCPAYSLLHVNTCGTPRGA